MKTRRTVLIMILLGVLILGSFYYLNQHPKRAFYDADRTITAVDELLSRNMERNYPSTPGSVVSLYCDILQVMYNENYTEEELLSLLDMMRKLFDDEFLEINPRMTQYYTLVNELNEAAEAKKKISDIKLQKTAQIQEWESSGYSYANVKAEIYMSGSSTTCSSEEFILRKDSAGRWKILGWREQNKN